MTSKEMTVKLRMSHWAQVMKDRAESGLSVKKYCEKMGIHENSYFYWQKKLREAVGGQIIEAQANMMQPNIPQSGFVEVRVPEALSRVGNCYNKGISIDLSGVHISTDSVYPVDKLIKLLKGLVRQ